MKHCDICIVGWWSHWTKFTAMVKQQAFSCKQRYSKASIIVVVDATCKNVAPTLKNFGLAGRRVFNRKMGDEFV